MFLYVLTVGIVAGRGVIGMESSRSGHFCWKVDLNIRNRLFRGTVYCEGLDNKEHMERAQTDYQAAVFVYEPTRPYF